MHPFPMKELIDDFKNPSCKEEEIIKEKLTIIQSLYSENNGSSYKIINEFCDIYTYIKKINNDHINKIANEYENKFQNHIENKSSFITQSQNAKKYINADILLHDFYNFWKKEDELPYNEIRYMSVIERKNYVNPTLFDYVARIKSFAKSYVNEICDESILPDDLNERILFVYNNIEVIVSNFKIKDENNNISKQRQNTRSALRKLNEFKHETNNN